MTLFHSSNEKSDLTIAVALLGEVACTEGNYAEARKLFREAHLLKQARGDEWEIVLGLEDFAYLALAQGYMERAACLYGAAEQWNGGRWYRYPSKQQKHEKRVSAVREALGEEAFATAWKTGSRMSPEEAIAYALNTD
ncbi:MAG TPA: hypothetical protein VKU00_29625 [Chthonomonadaceae bacterium]|nr:hypothetical protein [Chthonomonadaceae bacterium]